MKSSVLLTSIIIVASIVSIHFFKENSSLNNNQNIVDNYSLIDTSSANLPDGYDYISNFNIDNYTRTNSFSQDSNRKMLFVDKKGIIFFDGFNETFLSVENAPNLIKKQEEKDIFYLACGKGYGVLKKEQNGNYTYESLSSTFNNEENYFNIIEWDEKIIFVSEKKLIQVNVNELNKSIVLFEDQKRVINYVFEFKNVIYINFYKTGLHKLEKGKPVKISEDPLFSDNQILFALPSNNSIILGLNNNTIILFDGKNYKNFKTTSDEYIKESIITGAIDYKDNQFILITLNGGVVILNKTTGETVQTVNYRTGLPDDEIFAAYTDIEGGLWLSHEYGISRIGFDLPVKNYGNYPGLQGKINSTFIDNQTLYVGTGEGLFYLSEIKNYEEVKVATDKWVKSIVQRKSAFPDKNVTEEEQNMNSDVRPDEESGFLSKWKKRKEEKKKENEEKDALVEKLNQGIIPEEDFSKNNKDEIEENKSEFKKITEYRKIYELQSVKYMFKKIEGINGKCRKLIKYNNSLLAVTNSGLFSVNNKNVSTIIPDEYVYNLSNLYKNNKLFATTSKGIYQINESSGNIQSIKLESNLLENIVIKNILIVNDSVFWATSTNNVYLINTKDNRIISFEKFKIDSDVNEDIKIINYNNYIRFFSGSQAFYYNDKLNNIISDKDLNDKISNGKLLFPDDNSFMILNKTINYFSDNKLKLNNIKFINLFDQIYGSFTGNKDTWVFTRENMIYRIKNDKIETYPFKIYVNSIKDNSGKNLEFLEKIKIKSNYKKLHISLSSPCYIKNDFVTYYYAADSYNENEFIEATGSNVIIPELASGTHTVYFYALNKLNDKSNVIEIKIEIIPPFWQSYKFILGVSLLFMVSLFLGMTSYYNRKQRKIKEYNEILELKVKERTYEISKQNELIQKQNDEIKNQSEKILIQNQEITGSIRYAEKIQKAVLSDIDIYSKYVSGFFNLFKPRDIVSGDFYWTCEAQNKLFVAAADCTGHGVPGGFLSMLGVTFLNEIINESVKSKIDIKAADILNILRNKIITTFHKQHEDTAQDGMDISIVIFDKANMTLNYAGANNPAYIARNGLLSKIEADRMPVGYNKKLNSISFTNKFLKLKQNDLIYLFSDGYADQFGGEHNKKFNVSRFRELLLHLQKFGINEQKQIADTILMKWQNENIQIDDILLIGIQI